MCKIEEMLMKNLVSQYIRNVCLGVYTAQWCMVGIDKGRQFGEVTELIAGSNDIINNGVGIALPKWV